MFLKYLATVFGALEVLSIVVLALEVLGFFFYIAEDLFSDGIDSFSIREQKIIKIAGIIGLICLIILIFLPGKDILLGQ